MRSKHKLTTVITKTLYSLYLNIIIFIQPILYLHFYIYFIYKKKTLKNKLQVRFHCSRHIVSQFFCQQIFKENNTTQCNAALASVVHHDQSHSSLHPWLMTLQ
jgi:hypothetical protein